MAATITSLHPIHKISNFTSSYPNSTASFNPFPKNLTFTLSPKNPFKPLISHPTHQSPHTLTLRRATAADSTTGQTSTTTFHGHCYVVGDNIDTDQIIPSEYLTLVPSNPEEYKKLGYYALIGLPSSYQTRFVEPGEFKSKYSIVIAGDNFGCGSSREHALVALGAAEVNAVVAESYARIFFRNSVATGEVYPLESEVRICEECKTGDNVYGEFQKGEGVGGEKGEGEGFWKIRVFWSKKIGDGWNWMEKWTEGVFTNFHLRRGFTYQ